MRLGLGLLVVMLACATGCGAYSYASPDRMSGGNVSTATTEAYPAAPAEAGSGWALDGYDDAEISGELQTYRQVDEVQNEPYEVAQADAADPGASEPTPTPQTPDEGAKSRRIVIYTGLMYLAVMDVPGALASAIAGAEALGGWVQSSTQASVVLRIPAAELRGYMESVRALGTVQSESLAGQDVTEEYFDLEIRLRNALDLRDRYAALLAKANTVADALAIETELARLTGEIESMKGRLRYLQQNAAFSTLELWFSQPTGQQGNVRITLPFYWLNSLNLSTLYGLSY